MRPSELKEGRKFLLAPSLLSADPLAIGDGLLSLEGEGDWIHVDIMDGHFVPNLSYGPALVGALRRSFTSSFIDVHIMVEPVENFLDMFLDAEPDLLTVHAEATFHIHRALSHIRERGVRPGVSINPGTPVGLIEPILPFVDLVLIMSVNPGFGAQKFIGEVMPKVKDLVRYRLVNNLDYLIEIDGGVNIDNAADLVRSGCDVLVAGNAVLGAANPAQAAKKLKDAVSDYFDRNE